MITRDTKFEGTGMPEATLECIKAFVFDGTMPGGFVLALLTNNLRDAIGKGDPGNLEALKASVLFCHWEIPGNCWGSVAAVERWMELRAESGPWNEEGYAILLDLLRSMLREAHADRDEARAELERIKAKPMLVILPEAAGESEVQVAPPGYKAPPGYHVSFRFGGWHWTAPPPPDGDEDTLMMHAAFSEGAAIAACWAHHADAKRRSS